MEPVRVWTKQHAGVAEELARTGVYRAKGRYIALDLEEHASLVLEVYDWLVAHTPAAPHRPEGAEYPVWVSFLREGTMLPGEGAVILELELDPELITRINVAKWGAFRPDCGASGGSGSWPSGDLPRTSPAARQKSGRQLKYFSGQTYRESPRHWTNSVSCGARAWISYRRAVSVSR